jgi:DNA-binding response OmpR family regulator
MAGIGILIVEDNAMQSKLVSFLLEEAGHTVQIAESGERALEVLRSFRPDLILMDLQLPGKDGLELTRDLRLNPIHHATPIIALTAYSDPSSFASAREAGCNGCISKPIDPAVFVRQVQAQFGRASGDDTDFLSDSGDLLAEMRNNFLAEGLEQCAAVLKALKSHSGSAPAAAQRVIRRWAGVGGALGFPEISTQARRIEALFTATVRNYDDIVRGFETAHRRFCAGTRTEPTLPGDLVRDLMDARIGLVNFSAGEADRIRKAAHRAKLEIGIEHNNGDSMDSQTGYSALIVNECGVSSEAILHRPQWSIPAVFIGSRASLGSLSKLPSPLQDFMLAPWEAEEILLRVYRLRLFATRESAHAPDRRPRILVADDDPDIVTLVLATLAHSGMDCDIARSGQQALDAVHHYPPDAIILDVNMVDLDGFEVLKKLRHNLLTQEIPVLLLTGRNQASDIAQGFGFGADDYVIKPFQPASLVKRLEKLMLAAARNGASFSPSRDQIGTLTSRS